MIAHVALRRLDRVHYRSSVDGHRVYESTLVCAADWLAIQNCVRYALGFGKAVPEPDDDPLHF